MRVQRRFRGWYPLVASARSLAPAFSFHEVRTQLVSFILIYLIVTVAMDDERWRRRAFWALYAAGAAAAIKARALGLSVAVIDEAPMLSVTGTLPVFLIEMLFSLGSFLQEQIIFVMSAIIGKHVHHILPIEA